jgi:uncharacterized 2Fe-2S/4Fe-4S cluster protein (DUF4445 family)
MIHILAGVDPKSIGMSPYQPVFTDARSFKAETLGFSLKNVMVQTLPQVSGFIGSDTLSACLAVDLVNQPEGSLLVDLGTNGEIVLKGNDKYYSTSCATGPAFEGATLSCGTQAVPGALNSVTIDGNQVLTGFSIVNPFEINKLIPSGICGAGVISAVAQFCEKQIITSQGAFASGEKRYTLVPGNDETGQPSIYISQKDIRSVQLGKSALITGIEYLLKKADILKPVQIIIAGAFGSYLGKQDLIRLGMVPEIDLDHIKMVGNAAGTGAVMALCDEAYMSKAVELADKIEIVDLVREPLFQDNFVKNLYFPIVGERNP